MLLAYGVWLPLFLAGALVYALSGRTPRICFHAMRRLYGPSNGFFNALALRAARRLRPPEPPTPLRGFLGEMHPDEVARLVASLDAEGIAMFERPVPAAICDELHDFALRTPSKPMGSDSPVLYESESARSLRYDFSEQDILSNPAACRVALDGTLAAIAGAYFRARPIYDFSAMWWTTRFGEKDYSAAAQEFHFDMDRLAFLKFFVYLSDVDEASGPHVFVAGSHRDKPVPLRDPVRFEDALVRRYYPDSIRHVTGPRGTIFAVDTRGIHKGMPVVAGDRLAFQVEFTTSLFGQNYPSPTLERAVLAQAGIGTLDPDVFRHVRLRD